MSSATDAIARVVGRLRWRLRLQAALRHGLVLGALGLFAFAVAVVLVKTWVLPGEALTWAGALAIALPLVGVGVGLAKRLDPIRLAAALDEASGLSSRLGSALAFARIEAPTAMQRLAIEDALTALPEARPARAAPWRWGLFGLGLGALGVALALTTPAVLALQPEVAPTVAGALERVVVPKPFERPKAEIRKDDKERLEALAKDLAELERETKEDTDPTVRDFLDELNELIRALQEGRISPEEANAKMAALEKALAEWKEQKKDAEAMEQKLAEAAEKQKKAHKELDELLQALKEKDLAEAAKELEELAKKVEEKRLSDKEKEKIGKDLEQLAKDLQSDRQKEKERLEKERDRLKEKEKKEKDRFAQKDKDRLKENERRLEQLEQERQQGAGDSEAQRQLESLSDDLSEAAQDLMRRINDAMKEMQGAGGEQGPESEKRRQQAGEQGEQGESGQPGQSGKQGGMSEEDLRRAAEALERMAKSGQGRQQMRVAEGRMVDVKEMMRRGQSGQSGQSGQGKSGKSGKQGQQGEGEGEDGEAWRAFEQGANGESGEGQDGEGEGEGGKDGQGGKEKGMMLGQGGKKGDGMMLLGGKMPGGLPMRGNGGQGDAKQGEGIGEGHDKRLLGDKTSMDVKTQDDFVAGQQGEGESKSQVVFTAAKKGFASKAYAEVHQDYAGVVEDALEKEHIPPGKRTYVRRYFDLIRPR